MSAALILLTFGAAPQDLPGVRFDCTPGGFHVFAPTSREQGAYRTDHPFAQRTEAWQGAPPFGEGIEITDRLPASLTLLWRREHNSPVTLTIVDYDASAATARYLLSSERNPASRVSTRVTSSGTCTAKRIGP
jgi:hypothetical protein